MNRLLPLAAGALLASAAAPRPAILVEEALVRVPAGGQTTAAAYLVLKNPSDRPDRLVGASCDCARTVTLHQSVTQNGVSKMLDLKAVDAPAKAEVSFAASGRHLMLEGLKQPMKPGDKLTLTLNFERAGPIKAVFTADPMAGMAGMAGMHHGH